MNCGEWHALDYLSAHRDSILENINGQDFIKKLLQHNWARMRHKKPDTFIDHPVVASFYSRGVMYWA